jgi:hypothetical protein
MSQQSIVKGFHKVIKKKKVKREEKVQLAVCKYLRDNYPDVVFWCDLASGMRLPIHIAAMNKRMRSSRGIPDLFIAQPRGVLSGLFLEFKGPDVQVFKKDGSLRSDNHLQEQENVLIKLRDCGYKAEFACGYAQAVEIIDAYLSK